MNCPNCNAPNPPEAIYCESCNILLPSPAEAKRQKRAAVIKAILTAIFVPVFYFFMMYFVVTIWMVRFSLSVPAGITENEFMTLYTELFNKDAAYINMIAACLSALVAAVFYSMKRRPFANAVNIRSASPVKVGSALVCGLTLQIPLGIILSLIPFPESVFNNHSEIMTATTSPMWIQLMYGVVIAPVIEEIFFRGIVHDRLSKVMPLPLAAALSSAGFALIHGELLSIIVAFACGYVLALLYSRFKTVLVPIAFHMGFNLLSYAVDYLTDPVLTIAAAVASVGLFIGSTFLLFKRDGESE